MANFKIMRNGLNTEIVGDPHIGQSSEDVTVTVTDDGTYQEYDKKLYYSYVYRNQVYRAIADKNSSNEFVIPMTAFLEPGIVKLSLELSNGTNKPTCNACFISTTDGAKSVAASDILPDDATWEQYVASYVKSHADTLKGEKGDKGEKGEKGDKGDGVQNLQIGGRNLVSGGEDEVSSSYPSSGNKDLTRAFNISVPSYATKFVLSFEAKSTVDGDVIESYLFQPNTITKIESSSGQIINYHSDGKIETTLSTSWQRYWIKYTAKEANTRSVIFARLNAGKGSGTVSIRNSKLETGDVPSDWTPSLEDIKRSTLSYSIDAELSSTSTNPVQNKIIKGELDKKADAAELGIKKVTHPSSDTAVTINSGEYHVFPTMASLTITPGNVGTDKMFICGFEFTSGSTPTVLTLKGCTLSNSDDVTTGTYEVNILGTSAIVRLR